MATLRQIQTAELDCLKEIDRICKSNGISYSLAYGTMLGAVRHQGFIPWDDDLDVYMSLKEFKRFRRCFKSDGYFLQTERTDPESPFIIYKIRKNNTRMVERGMDCLNIHQGIWADIFIYCDSAKHPAIKKIQHKLTIVLRTLRCRTLNRYNHRENLLQKIANRLPCVIVLWIDGLLVNIIELLGSTRSGESLVFSNGSFRSMHFPKKMLEETADYVFEDSRFPGIKAYDAYLKTHYGDDYMTPIKYDSHSESYDEVEC